MMRVASCMFMIAALCGVLCGCGSDDVWITGKVVRNGQPLASDPNQQLEVVLYRLPDKDGPTRVADELYNANTDDDGSFEVPGPDGRGIPRGKYRVAVALHPGRAVPAGTMVTKRQARANAETDILADAFSPSKSPYIYDLTSSQTLDIDLATTPTP